MTRRGSALRLALAVAVLCCIGLGPSAAGRRAPAQAHRPRYAFALCWPGRGVARRHGRGPRQRKVLGRLCAGTRRGHRSSGALMRTDCRRRLQSRAQPSTSAPQSPRRTRTVARSPADTSGR